MIEPSTTTSEPTRRVRTVLIAIASKALFAAMLPLLVLALLRILRIEHSTTVVVFETTLPVALLPAYVAFTFAVVARRRALAAVAAFLVLCHVAWVFPELGPARSLPSAVRDAPRFTLFDQNILFENPTPEKIAAEIVRSNADVVFLEELTRPKLDAIQAAHGLDSYGYRFVHATWGPDGLGIFSRTPLLDAKVVRSPGFPQMRAQTIIAGHTVTLWNVHMLAPVGGPIDEWEGDLHQLRDRLRAETGDVVAAGDFNSTWSHRPFRELLGHGVREVHRDRGRGWARTWPVNGVVGGRIGGFVRLDHLLTKGLVRGVAIRETPSNGSDHAGLVTTLALPG